MLNAFITTDDATEDVAKNALNIESSNPEHEMEENSGISLKSIYWELIEIVVSLTAIYLLLKMKMSIRSDVVIYSLILFQSIAVNIYFVFDPDNPLIQIKFLYTIAFAHMMRLNSFFFVSILCTASSVWYMNVRISRIEKDDQGSHALEIGWQVISVVTYIIFWMYYTYWDEINRKIKFVLQYRNAKELQKLKSIINILIPNLVRSRLTDGKKNFVETQGEATIIFIDLDDFDNLVNQHTGKELIELLDKVYNAFDQLCEQNGIQKIETVGKTYMACGGLKSCERAVESRLLGSHHSVRVTDFACNALKFAESYRLRFGNNLGVKIGIHTGQVIAGVVGETKP